jgi:KaiC/GvpD/RAD55 family RecA-like ATPase
MLPDGQLHPGALVPQQCVPQAPENFVFAGFTTLDVEQPAPNLELPPAVPWSAEGGHLEDSAPAAGFLKAELLADAEQRAKPLFRSETSSPTRIRTAGQRIADAATLPPLIPLVGPLWETPGVAILVGDTGVGKSILSVHIAHLLSSPNNDLLGLPCGVEDKVLYYDFELTDRQFEKRFATLPFTKNFCIGDTNPLGDCEAGFTFDHIEADLEQTGAQFIVLDNISALAMKTTADADESIKIMKGLKRLQAERGISCLVVAHTPKVPPGTPISINHLAGSKALPNFADSVFFIARSAQSTALRYIKQVKNRSGEEMPGVLVCELTDQAGYVGFTLVGQGEEYEHLAMPASPSVATEKVVKAALADVAAELTSRLISPLSSGELENQLMVHFDTSDRTVRDRLRDLRAGKYPLVNSEGTVCTLTKTQEGREVLYALQPIIQNDIN